MKPVRFCILLLVFLLLSSSACSPFSWAAHRPALLSPAPTAKLLPQASDFPRGRFSSLSMPNMVLLAIENNGHFYILLGGDVLDSGRIEVVHSQVWVDSVACLAQNYESSLYNWAYEDEDTLAFQPAIPDPCPERRQYLSEQYQPKFTFVFIIPDRGVSRQWSW